MFLLEYIIWNAILFHSSAHRNPKEMFSAGHSLLKFQISTSRSFSQTCSWSSSTLYNSLSPLPLFPYHILVSCQIFLPFYLFLHPVPPLKDGAWPWQLKKILVHIFSASSKKCQVIPVLVILYYLSLSFHSQTL